MWLLMLIQYVVFTDCLFIVFKSDVWLTMHRNSMWIRKTIVLLSTKFPQNMIPYSITA